MGGKNSPEYMRRWRTDNADKCKAYQAKRKATEDPVARAAKVRARRTEKIDETREKNRIWAAAHPECSARRMRKYREKHPERSRASARETKRKKRAINPEALRAIQRKWAKKNGPAWFRAWHKKNPEKAFLYRHLRRARKAGAGHVPFSAQELRSRMAAFGSRCFYCFGPFDHVDHATPLARGGAHALWNLVPACKRCNVKKHTKTLLEFVVALGARHRLQEA